MKKRPVAVPLITVDPYFSIWSCSDKLYNGYTKHWTEKPWPMYAAVYLDGESYPVCGTTQDFKTLRKRITQTDLKITPLSTIYTFENEIVMVEENDEKHALIEKTLEPVVKGVVVVCSGADDIKVVSDITNAVSVALNVTTNRICVIKME